MESVSLENAVARNEGAATEGRAHTGVNLLLNEMLTACLARFVGLHKVLD